MQVASPNTWVATVLAYFAQTEKRGKDRQKLY